jgi:uncharacterized protein YdaU (DUF1376 family)
VQQSKAKTLASVPLLVLSFSRSRAEGTPNKQTSKQANKQTSKQANKQTSKQANKQTSKQANKQTNKQTNNQSINQSINQSQLTAQVNRTNKQATT